MIICNCNAITCEKVEEACIQAPNFTTMLCMIKYKESCGICFDILKTRWEELNGTEEETDCEEDWDLSGEL